MTNLVFLMYDSVTWIVLQLWCWLATKVHITYPPRKIYCTKTSTVALLATLVELLTWIVYHGDSVILSNICASTSYAISSIHLVMVPAKRGICATIWTAASPKSSWQMSLAAGRINSSSRVKGFLALVIWLATKNDALSADTFDEVVAFYKCFCSMCSHFFFFWKTPKAYLLMQVLGFHMGKQFWRFHDFTE